MRFTATICAIMAACASAQVAPECLAESMGCANAPDGCCADLWCNRWSMVCESTSQEAIETVQEEGFTYNECCLDGNCCSGTEFCCTKCDGSTRTGCTCSKDLKCGTGELGDLIAQLFNN